MGEVALDGTDLLGGIYLREKLDTDFMTPLPDHPASLTGVRPSCQMQFEVIRKIINVTDR
jgi:hypothetical protein